MESVADPFRLCQRHTLLLLWSLPRALSFSQQRACYALFLPDLVRLRRAQGGALGPVLDLVWGRLGVRMGDVLADVNRLEQLEGWDPPPAPMASAPAKAHRRGRGILTIPAAEVPPWH